MPKQKITRDMVVEAAFRIARQEGIEAVLVKRIAQELGCSVQPIYSYCNSMEELRQAVAERARMHMAAYLAQQIDPGDIFRRTGFAYVHYAKEEPHLFRLYVQMKRDYVSCLSDLYQQDANPRVPYRIAADLNIPLEKAAALHLNMLIFTTGIGTIMASTPKGLEEDELISRLEGAYQAFLAQATT